MRAKIKWFSNAGSGSLTAAFAATPRLGNGTGLLAVAGGCRLRYVCAAVQALGDHVLLTGLLDTHFKCVGFCDVAPPSPLLARVLPPHPPTSGSSTTNLNELFALLKGGSGFPILNPILSALTDYSEE